jgi:hypothetical protein
METTRIQSRVAHHIEIDALREEYAMLHDRIRVLEREGYPDLADLLSQEAKLVLARIGSLLSYRPSMDSTLPSRSRNDA